MAFIIYDLILMVLFVTVMAIFLYSKRKNLKREGILLLYRTKLGIKLINYTGNKYKKTLKALSYISISMGYFLMVVAVYFVGKIVWVYIAYPSVVRKIKVPPVMPLVPYIDKVVPGLPEFYFIYWIIIIAIIAIAHEFAHGIFMKRYNIGIKSTGFGFFPFFLPIFLAAFVEQDEKSMESKKKFEQMAVLSAGTFANVLTAIFFFVVLIIFFSLMFVPAGVVFSSYAYSIINVEDISSVNDFSISNLTYEKFLDMTELNRTTKVETDEKDYLVTREMIENPQNQMLFEEGKIILYYDAPAINAELEGAITKIDGVKINSKENLRDELLKYSPGEKIKVETITDGEIKEYEITLGENPENKSSPWIGIGFIDGDDSGFIGKIYNAVSSFKKPEVYYKPKFDGMSLFIYNLLWWIILISISVAIINMLPVGIFDGGKFFYLTILGITKSEKISKGIFKGVTLIFLFLVFILMAFWIFNVV